MDLSPRTPQELNHYQTPKWKRAIDIIGSISLIVLLSPLLAAIAIYIRIVAGAPITYCQPRLGEMGTYFTIYKFRTMSTEKESTSTHRDYIAQLQDFDATLKKPDFADRLIPGGEFLRSHAIDELPQLFNVLFGSMSLVGPRPDVLEWDDYPPQQRRRFEATPGMTGLWQVSGKNKLSFSEMVDLDLQYIQNRSPGFDLWILFKTLWVVIQPDE